MDHIHLPRGDPSRMRDRHRAPAYPRLIFIDASDGIFYVNDAALLEKDLVRSRKNEISSRITGKDRWSRGMTADN